MIKKEAALNHLMDLLAIEGLSGREKNVAKAIQKKLLAAGCKKSWMKFDQAHQKIDPDYEIGNLIVQLPGTIKAPRRMLMGHMDTVPLCRGAVPVKKGKRIVSKGKTALGADNRTAVSAIVSVAEALLTQKIPHPPLTLLFTIAEEVGLLGAKHVTKTDLGNPKMAFNIDSGDPNRMVIAAIGADRWEIDVIGRSSHAGVHPEDGVSAVAIAALAIQDVVKRGYFGKVVKGRKKGTSKCRLDRGRRGEQPGYRPGEGHRGVTQPRRRLSRRDHECLPHGFRDRGQEDREQQGRDGEDQVQGLARLRRVQDGHQDARGSVCRRDREGNRVEADSGERGRWSRRELHESQGHSHHHPRRRSAWRAYGG